MSTSDRLELGDVIEVAPGRRVRLRLGPAAGSIRRDWRGRIAVRNVTTNRLSYIPEARLLRAKQNGRWTRIEPETTPTGQVRTCDARHPETGARCELPLDHAENHRGAFAHGIAQWPYPEAAPTQTPEGRETMPVLVEAFRFTSYQNWVDTAQHKPWTWVTTTSGKHSEEICADSRGRVCRMGRDFQRAHDEGAFPIIAYRVRDAITEPPR